MQTYKANDLVLIRCKRGMKLAEICAINERSVVLKIWNATRKTFFTRPVCRLPGDVYGCANESELRMFRFPSPAVVDSKGRTEGTGTANL